MKLLLALLVFVTSSVAFGDSLNLYFIKSPYGINWSSPWLMTTSTLVNQLAPARGRSVHSISHAYAEIKCDSTGTHLYRGMTSISNDEERELIFKKQYGLGVIFHTFKGKLEKNAEIQKDLADYWGDKRLAVLEVEISPESCQRMVDYVNEYEALGYGLKYSGLQADPLKREGAGCSAFAASFLRVAGLEEDFFPEWKEIIDVPLRLVGGPMTNKKVSLAKVLKAVRARWTGAEPHYHLEAWNPDRMHAWVKRMVHENGGETIGRTHVYRIDRSDRPTPTGPFWLN